jgi:hypothetical protein
VNDTQLIEAEQNDTPNHWYSKNDVQQNDTQGNFSIQEIMNDATERNAQQNCKNGVTLWC